MQWPCKGDIAIRYTTWTFLWYFRDISEKNNWNPLEIINSYQILDLGSCIWIFSSVNDGYGDGAEANADTGKLDSTLKANEVQ